jgi:ATP-dependent RNA helicase DeaD
MSIETVLRFAQLGLSAPVLQAIDEIGYETPSPIQARSIPPMLEGRDLLGQAQTGTGKTAAFALPLLCRIDPSRRDTQALVLTPTRELAIQVAEAIHSYARHLGGVQVLPIYGGQHIGAQLRPLQRGVQVVVGTPGRIIDHLDRGTLKLDTITTVVLDEADEMLRMGFIEDVDRILSEMPSTRQVALFSATMPSAVRRIADRHLKDPAVVTIESATATVAAVRQRYIVAPWRQKLDVMTRILESVEFNAMLIFVRTKVATVEVAEKLEARGHAVTALNGDMTQQLRERAVQRLKDGTLDIVVATDVAARGLDVDRITHVVNYDIPNDTEAYVHRIGRTGRAGREGEAILLVQPRERRMLRSIEQATGQSITPMELPSAADVTDLRVTKFKQLVHDTIESEDLEFFTGVLASLQDEHEHSHEAIAAALAFLVQQDRPLQQSPEEFDRFAGGGGFDRERGGDRGGRHERGGERTPREAGDRSLPPGVARYRLEVGRRHNVQPKHIVGAITNETGLDGRDIGRIEVYESFCIVDMPAGMPEPIMRHLQVVDIFGHPLRVSPVDGRGAPPPPAGSGGAPPKPRAPFPGHKAGGKPPFKGKPGGKPGKPGGKPAKGAFKGKAAKGFKGKSNAKPTQGAFKGAAARPKPKPKKSGYPKG